MASPQAENDKTLHSLGQPVWKSRVFLAVFFVLMFAGLYWVSLSHYLLFHALIEFPSIIVAFSIFVIGWNSRRFARSNLLVFFSIFFLPVSIFDFLHTLSYKGTGVFPVDGANLATQYWIAARYIQAGSCIATAIFIKRMDRFNPEKILPVFLFLSTAVALLIFPFGLFPDCYLEGSGLTAFKIWSEVFICLLLAASAFLIWSRRRYWDQNLLAYLFPSILLFIFSELAFTLYQDVYGFFNFLGHVFKFASFVCIYFGLIEGSLKRPYSILFRDLVESEKKLLNELRERKAAEEQAIQARNEAHHANEAKSRFLANIAHEIRTPLNAILGLTELTLVTDLKGDSKEYVSMLRSSGVSLRGLVDNVLDMSKIEEGKFDFFIQPFDLRRKIEDIIKLLDVLAREKGVKLFSEVAGDVPQILEGDPQRLRQVLNNLIVNAIKFTTQGEISLSVTSSSNHGEDKVRVEFQVRDTGIGIPKERIKDLFKKFSQIEGPFSREYTGTGLGLAISQEIVEKMGGTIRVESREGEGSTFYFTVPFQVSSTSYLPQSLGKTDKSAAAATLTAASEKPPIKVLLVEDDLINRKVMTWMLTQKGYLVSGVSDGHEAVEEAGLGKHDCILMDLRMPKMDGIAATKAIRGNWPKDLAPVRIIGISASPFEEERKRCLDAGMDDYLSKPVHWHVLFVKINQCRKNLTPQPKLPERESVDFSDLISAIGENREALVDMIDEFLEACPGRLRDILGTIPERDGSSLEKKAHGFKSAVGIWGDSRAFDVLSELEEAGRTDDFGQAEGLIKNLPQELEKLKLALADLRDSL
ncbi:MAG: response regulator [Deltaproteobacteria bacterium]|nr:response regulator [Deltaproteobacteria bacterium]